METFEFDRENEKLANMADQRLKNESISDPGQNKFRGQNSRPGSRLGGRSSSLFGSTQPNRTNDIRSSSLFGKPKIDKTTNTVELMANYLNLWIQRIDR
eukprot:UN22159